uniref:Uncharacterized protein n=1 Tax=Poecilia latipinna TaxID=48699 RepID=A0A3B3V6B5_9TELE
MEPDGELNPDTDDLPLRANTNHILVRHYVLDLTVCFDKKIISGSIVLFLEPCSAEMAKTKADIGPETGDGARQEPNEEGTKFGSDTQGSDLFQSSNAEDFTLVLDCCDLEVSKVEEVDTDSVSAALGFPLTAASEDISVDSQAGFIQHLFSMPSSHWKEKHRLFSLCSRSPGIQKGNSLHFHTDRWSLQVKKMGVTTSQDFPRIIRIYYMTRTLGGSVRWTKDQDNRECVYTAGSPINNRALFPCQEPPVAMSTWQARVRAPSDCVVLMSGEEEAVPAEDGDTRKL